MYLLCFCLTQKQIFESLNYIITKLVTNSLMAVFVNFFVVLLRLIMCYYVEEDHTSNQIS